MLNLLSILKFVHSATEEKSPRFIVEDDEHIYDKETGVKLHLYDSWFKITRKGKTIVTLADMTQDEQQVIWELKQQITKPSVIKHKQDNYMELIRERRQSLSDYFESPEALGVSGVLPQEEKDTEIYTG